MTTHDSSSGDPDGQSGQAGQAPDWEAALRRGQAADGGQGGVEPELGVLNLLRHAREPAQLSGRELDRVWADVAREVAGVPWWRRPWVMFGAPALAAAAVLAVVLLPGEGVAPPQDGTLADATAGLGAVLQQQFRTLEPVARARVTAAIGDGRGTLRGELLARVTADAEAARTQGGAP